LHGFITLTDNTLIAYKVTDFYAPENDGAIAWNDPSLMIDWGTDSPILSDKDARAPQLDPDRPIFPVDWNA
jgi:dTDP-4-dehydrorhamnose 3,5-epimerase